MVLAGIRFGNIMGASLKSIKKRISSVRSTQKITKAMKMVAAAKLRRAESTALQARPYKNALQGITERVAFRAGYESHPFFTERPKVQRREVWVLSSDRGLCGGFNGNLLRRFSEVFQDWKQKGVEVVCRLVGRRGRDFFNAKHLPREEFLTGMYDKITPAQTRPLVETMVGRFLSGECDEIWISYNRFKSVLSQEVMLEKILPFICNPSSHSHVDYLYEPSRQKLLDGLLKEALVAHVHQAFLESYASELAARMAAMDNATNNASDMIHLLTLQYNRARQAAITTELMDIVNGAEALR